MIDARLAPFVSRKNRHLPLRQQSAALCYRIEQGRAEVLLITTRKSRRWIIPKGWLINGLTPSETACREAWEEAGIRGLCEKQALGRFHYQKRRRKRGPCCAPWMYFHFWCNRSRRAFPNAGNGKESGIRLKKRHRRLIHPSWHYCYEGWSLLGTDLPLEGLDLAMSLGIYSATDIWTDHDSIRIEMQQRPYI